MYVSHIFHSEHFVEFRNKFIHKYVVISYQYHIIHIKKKVNDTRTVMVDKKRWIGKAVLEPKINEKIAEFVIPGSWSLVKSIISL